MRKTLWLLATLSVAALILLNSWQGFRFEKLVGEVGAVEQRQREWLDRNKKAIAAIAVLASPKRVESQAVNVLGLERVDGAQTLRVEIEAAR